MYRSVLFSVAAGILGTGIGGVIACLMPKKEDTEVALYSFSAGIMLALSLTHLLPEARDISAVNSIVGVITGFIMFAAADKLPYERTNRSKSMESERTNAKLAAVIFAVIFLHNLPEGLAIGSGAETTGGIVTAILIGAHNVPEGICVGMPFLSQKHGRIKSICAAFVSGTSTVVGAIVGSVTAERYAVLIPLSLATAAGAMIAVVVLEMMKSKIKPAAFSAGIMLAICISVL